MTRIALLSVLLLANLACADVYQDAVDDPGRPGSDREDDDRRKPAEVMAFTGLGRGDTVIEIGAGRGYTTELASRIVGPDGVVYAQGLDPARIIGNRLPNVTTLAGEGGDPAAQLRQARITPGSVDRVLAFFTLHDNYLDGADEARMWCRALLDALRPGGEFVVLDNTAEHGSGMQYASDLHRIDPQFLKDDILAAGFEFVSESDVLQNPDDDLGSNWWEDTATRKAGYQDRFAFKFRKP